MLKGVGADLVEVERIRQVLVRRPDAFCRRVYTPAEVKYCFQKAAPETSLAARFAAKEAVMKVLGTGWGAIGWTEIEVTSRENGRPELVLHGRASRLAGEQGISRWMLTLSHSRGHALAVVVAE